MLISRCGVILHRALVIVSTFVCVTCVLYAAGTLPVSHASVPCDYQVYCTELVSGVGVLPVVWNVTTGLVSLDLSLS